MTENKNVDENENVEENEKRMGRRSSLYRAKRGRKDELGMGGCRVSGGSGDSGRPLEILLLFLHFLRSFSSFL
jgi:hypothetical protein